MTEPSQYFKGRTVQEQMNEVIGYVDARAEEVAAAKADDVLEPAEQAKDDAIAAKEAAEQARDTTLAALPAVNERIDDVESDLNAVTLRVTTAEGDIVTIQGRITAVETKNTQQDTAIAALQTADGQNVKINQVGAYAVDLTTDQDVGGIQKIVGTRFRIYPASPAVVPYLEMKGHYTAGTPNTYMWFMQCRDKDDVEVGDLILSTDSNGNSQLSVALRKADGTTVTRIIATSV